MTIADLSIQGFIATMLPNDWAVLPQALQQRVIDVELPLACWIDQQVRSKGVFLLGVNGPQGSGKSTTCEALKVMLEHYFGLRVAVISIDDFYLTKQQRLELAASCHPLLATRGVPGTHDTHLAIETLTRLKSSGSSGKLALPRFNKAADDRFPEANWDVIETPVDVVLFEGWCIGALPEEDIAEPVNELEAKEDNQCHWRDYVNHALDHDYAKLFGLLDALVLFQVDEFSWVLDWRKQQELGNKEKAIQAGSDLSGIMNSAQIERFIMHYERVTNSCQRCLPDKADVLIHLNKERQALAMRWRETS